MNISSQQAIEDIIAGKFYPKLVLWGYCNGIFPMADDNDNIIWFCPYRRGIIELKQFAIPRTLRATIRKKKFKVFTNTDFETVIKTCADRGETWISSKIIDCYIDLHKSGYAHSVETYNFENQLVGGLYGVAIGGAFFGESMFHLQKDASKVALVALVSHLRKQKFSLLDTQWLTAHLARMGGSEITRSEYLIRLKQTLDKQCNFVEKERKTIEIEIDKNLFSKNRTYCE